MNDKEKTKISKFLSLVLRHKPDTIDITLDESGWVKTATLIQQAQRHGTKLTWDMLKEIVETNDKKRFEFGQGERTIRASQGHSVQVDLGYSPATPPSRLYHGSNQQAVNSILKSGLNKGQRHHVHLSEDMKTAEKVGSRRGDYVLFTIYAEEMHNNGFEFFQSTNGVWLTDHVPTEYLSFTAVV